MRAKKSYGQHFLNNEDMAQRIADYMDEAGIFESKKKVLEIGPGMGMLTKYLLKKDLDLRVVEADRDMVEYLERNFPALHGRIIGEDFLKLELDLLFPKSTDPQQLTTPESEAFTIIGNFPYNISSQIVFKMIDYRGLVPTLVGMFQKEMAERIIAPPGNKTYGVISVLTQAYYEGKMLMQVGSENFDPPPKVQSAVIELRRKEDAPLGCDEKLFRQVVKQAFSQRRKMLRNTMKVYFDDPAALEGAFFEQRPERLSVEDFVGLTNLVAGV